MRYASRIVIVAVALLLISGVLLALAQDNGNPPPPLTSTITYTVQPGDVLELIAARYDVDRDCLIQDNNLAKPGHIFPGNTLTISTDCPFYTGSAPVLNPRAGHTSGSGGSTASSGEQTYVVQANDTLDTIARKFNISVQVLSAANGSPKPTDLKVGMTLIVPAGAPAYGVFIAPSSLSGQGGGAVPPPGSTVYIVQPGDVLDLIAAGFNVQLKCLVERNGRPRPWFVMPGEQIIIPTDCPAYDGFSFVRTPNPAAIQVVGGSSGVVSTPVPPLAQVTPTPETLVQPTLPPPTAMSVTVIPPTTAPIVLPPATTPDAAVG